MTMDSKSKVNFLCNRRDEFLQAYPQPPLPPKPEPKSTQRSDTPAKTARPQSAKIEKCEKCNLNFKTASGFENHPCITRERGMDECSRRNRKGELVEHYTIGDHRCHETNRVSDDYEKKASAGRFNIQDKVGPSMVNKTRRSKYETVYPAPEVFEKNNISEGVKGRTKYTRVASKTPPKKENTKDGITVIFERDTKPHTMKYEHSKHYNTPQSHNGGHHFVERDRTGGGDVRTNYNSYYSHGQHKADYYYDPELKSCDTPGPKKFGCSICPRIFTTEKLLWNHVCAVHQGKGRSELSCNYRTNSRTSKHQKIQPKTPPFVCSRCTCAFYQHSELRLHIVHMHSDSHLQCPLCSYKGVSVKDTERHLNMHKNCDNTCCYCSQDFKKKSLLVKHLNTAHVDKKKHTCEQCNLGFDYINDYRKHEQKHYINDRSDMCKICKLQFKQIDALKEHMRTQHPSRPSLRTVGRAA